MCSRHKADALPHSDTPHRTRWRGACQTGAGVTRLLQEEKRSTYETNYPYHFHRFCLGPAGTKRRAIIRSGRWIVHARRLSGRNSRPEQYCWKHEFQRRELEHEQFRHQQLFVEKVEKTEEQLAEHGRYQRFQFYEGESHWKRVFATLKRRVRDLREASPVAFFHRPNDRDRGSAVKFPTPGAAVR
jgi:hypothetical protein